MYSLAQAIYGHAHAPGVRYAAGAKLALSAGCSLSSLTPMVAFGGVSYLACPTVFHHPLFRLASNGERLALATVTALADDDAVVAVDADGSGSMDLVTYFIVATSAALARDGA